MVVKQYEVGRFAIFSYVIGDEEAGEGLVIDPSGETDMLISEAESYGLRIKYVVNTHGHVDHIMGNSEMVKKTKAKIVIHEKEADRLTRTRPDLLDMFGATPSPPADLLVKQGDVIQVGKVGLQVLHTPGHSPGGICIHSDGKVFTGDTLFVGGVGRTDLPGGSWPLMLKSIQTKLLTLPDETIVLPGHNYGAAPTSTIGNEKRYNPFLRTE